MIRSVLMEQDACSFMSLTPPKITEDLIITR